MNILKESFFNADDARRIMELDPLTGIIKFKVKRGRIKAGSIAGGPTDTGYWRISISRSRYKAHRLVWLLHYGEWPAAEIDHIDGNGKNNAISNLRLSSHWQNACNTPKRKNNKSGYKRVCWHNQMNKWQCHISVNGKQKYLGLFDDPAEAHAVYCKAAAELHGEFANVA